MKKKQLGNSLVETMLVLGLVTAASFGTISTFKNAKAQAEQYESISGYATTVAIDTPYNPNSADVDELRAMAAELAKREKEQAQSLKDDNQYIYAEDL
ncbi:hypothetical protein [Stenotrophomonas maltophilia]|uniref:hypothetical protein n=1 Tax=Stenotrophomonas maltophilia TaxID=40324 RepID=UPI0012FD55B7|nr:hypothetical protein [Stenotrophomonas maltophilia]